jgi:transposase-like protein
LLGPQLAWPWDNRAGLAYRSGEVRQNLAGSNGRSEPMLTAPQLEAATLLALGELPRPDVAQRVGISERTLYRWMDLEEFKGEIER